MEVCTWEKMKGKYKTSCNHTPKSMGRGWTYCPFCCGLLKISKTFYHEQYHKKHKAEKQEYYKEYYQSHK